MAETLLVHRLENGLTLLAEPMGWLESAAFSLLIPAGCSRDPLDKAGLANFTCEMLQRGCGERSKRQFLEDLENLGVDCSASVTNAHTSFGNPMLADRLPQVLEIYADLVQRPHFPEAELAEGQLVCEQEVHAFEDDLPQRTMAELRRQMYPDPFGRMPQGTYESLSSITIADIRDFYAQNYRPNDMILSIAGKFDWEALKQQVEQLFGGWAPVETSDPETSPNNQDYVHLPHESAQTHIAIGYPSVPYGNEKYFQARMAVGVLSDGMSSRLFTEVRENRGLCYTVMAYNHSLRNRGSVICYAGTTTERAQETLDVTHAELLRIVDGVEQEELDRLKAKIKSSLIMQQESSNSRSSSLAFDWYFLGRVRQLEELRRIIDGMTCDDVNQYLRQHPPSDFRFATLGEKELEIPGGIS